jgi:hypothetical protein
MNVNDFNRIKDFIINDEAGSWKKVQELRKQFEQHRDVLFNYPGINSRVEAVNSGFSIIFDVLKELEGVLEPAQAEPGHGKGHLFRDYLHALILSEDQELDPKQVMVGLVDGTLHDLGCSIIDRYTESKRVVRHAEAGALFFWEIANSIGLKEEIALAIFYGIAAHTHYLSPQSIECADGITRVTSPYLDVDQNGKPLTAVHYARWVDRLDCLGPCYLMRHYLTMANNHEDYDNGSFYTVNFEDHMRVLLRDQEEAKTDPKGITLLEHFAIRNNQSPDSPYEKNDGKLMIELREKLKERGQRIISSFVDHKKCGICKTIGLIENRELLINDFHQVLFSRIEPSPAGEKAADSLMKKFMELSGGDDELAWLNAIKTILTEYHSWHQEITERVNDAGYIMNLPLVGEVIY